MDASDFCYIVYESIKAWNRFLHGCIKAPSLILDKTRDKNKQLMLSLTLFLGL